MKNEERIDTFANRLNQAMKIRNLKQADLVERTYLSKQQISQYVNGKFEAKQKAVFTLAQVLDVNESWLMGFDSPMEKHDGQNEVQDKIQICELIEKRYGKSTLDMLIMYNDLDLEDQAEIRGEMKQMLKADKYSVKKESKNA